MVETVKLVEEEHPVNEHTRKISVDLETFKEKKFETFFSAKSMTLFNTMDILHSFLDIDLDKWAEQEDYIHAAETVLSVSVVNDHGKKGAASAQELIGNTTKDESKLQFLLQVVQTYQKLYPDSKNETLSTINI